ncbi:hypothetical protein [Blastococcus brunescens]|uniref:ABC transporter ATP-binding protein n=1 Tax=Blastococcus brunescens TaxID=1564165 RepID=A0ABZ1AWJ4_9ACTN|nr:hypothetical protein [Blastococcus sp. BMG 8361]WRL62936.1 hypothetical protein U6N30_24200 [Blastococcus sp. BMG 8361]
MTTSTSTSPEIIRVTDVSKRFILHKEKSLKERVLRGGRRSGHSEDFWRCATSTCPSRPARPSGSWAPTARARAPCSR